VRLKLCHVEAYLASGDLPVDSGYHTIRKKVLTCRICREFSAAEMRGPGGVVIW